MSDEGPAYEIVFTPDDLLSMIALLANAVTHLGKATSQLAHGQNAAAEVETAQAGEQVDGIIALIRAKAEREGILREP